MTGRKLKRNIRRRTFLELAKGAISREQAGLCMAVLNTPEAFRRLELQVNARINPWKTGRMSGFDWKEFFLNCCDWIKENWDEILMIILKLAPLLLLSPQYGELPRR